MKYPFYYQNDLQWANYWQDDNPNDHSFVEIFTDKFRFILYVYPWYFGKNLGYIGRFGEILDSNYSQDDITLALNKASKIAKNKNCVFLKIDFDENFDYDFSDFKTNKNTKALQYKSTSTLDLSKIQDVSLDGDFYANSKEFWKTCNNNVQRYTKKTNINWIVSKDKTQDNFEKFWQVYKNTSDRQNFATHKKYHYENLYKLDFCKIIVVSDEQNEPQAVWFGITTKDTLTYLYGGNSDFALANCGQYKIQLEAVKTAVSNKLKFYDLGGYEIGKGYAKFKENYKGNIRVFSDPVDIILDSFWYNLINFAIKIRKFAKKISKKIK